ncbi:NTP transferase domain-containing protein [Clostridium sp. MSJ-11]|uniref:NTP transferase domain-containing protein n=1 Tax=Clostridium mobile TaxID=2841512 RepID=A0ABS6EJY5_9CLOT|nr:NTP transferase domain-containing protein [Clostridium mobile]MBU5484719.1 NTP transferase domain-containing protein [Clostridium mobile]
MISAIVIAAGFSRRMNREKLIMPIDKIPMIEKLLKEIKNSRIKEITLVYRNKEIKDIGDKYSVNSVLNHKANLGQSESIKLGVKSSRDDIKGYMFFVGDQPFIKNSTIDKLINEFYKDEKHIIVPKYGDNPGNPVIFPIVFREELLALKGDIGGRKIIKENGNCVKFIDVEDEIEGLDIDDMNTYYNVNRVIL